MAIPLPLAVLFELPGDSGAWSVVFGPVALASLASLLSLLGAVLRWRQERSLRSVVLLAPLVVVTPILTAYREGAGLLVMGLLLQPLALWVWWPVFWRLVGRPAPGPDSPRWAIARWAFVAGSLPAVWFASCTYGFVGEVNERVALLESLPTPSGAAEIEKEVIPLRIMGSDHISYRVPMAPEDAEAEVYRLLQEDGWARRPLHHVVRDGDCLRVYLDRWLFRSADTLLIVSLQPHGDCYRYPWSPIESPTLPPPSGSGDIEPFGIPLP